MRILITGGTGQLGRSLQRALAAHDVLAPGHADLDVTDPASINRAVSRQEPQVVIHTAALTDTTQCEREPALARAVNGIGAENIAKACRRAGARLISISTNEVFDGAKASAYLESDATGPLNAYAISKLDGEWLAAAACPDTLIIRVSWLYGPGGNNFVDKVKAAAASGRPLAFVTNEIATPTCTTDVATAIASIVDRQAPAGIYHLVNAGEASRYDWAVEILRLAGVVTDIAVERVTDAELTARGYAGPRKPPYSVLANTRAAALGVTLRPWKDALAGYFERASIATDA
jgi:dTDP-4-dehydrorhamnose reductase